MTMPIKLIASYRKFADVFIETGTHTGDTVMAAHNVGFKKIYTIELSDKFYSMAVKRFSKHPTVKCIHGDSSKVLPGILSELNEKAVFWLDGHWSMGDTAKGDKDVPLYDELKAIAGHKIKDHVLMIDDVRLMGDQKEPVQGWHDMSLSKIKELCLEINPKYSFTTEDGHVPNDILVARLIDG